MDLQQEQQLSPSEQYLQEVQQRNVESLSTKFQGGKKIIYYKGLESMANGLAYGTNAGLNIMSPYHINPLLDMGMNVTGLNSKIGTLASKIKIGNTNLTEGFSLGGKIGVRWVTPEAVSLNPADKHLMGGLNIVSDPKNTHFGRFVRQKLESIPKVGEFVKKLPTLNGSKAYSVVNKIIASPITKGIAKGASIGLNAANTIMTYEMMLEFAEMYNDHITTRNIKKLMEYKQEDLKPLSSESLQEKTGYNYQQSIQNDEELNFLLRDNNDPRRYL